MEVNILKEFKNFIKKNQKIIYELSFPLFLLILMVPLRFINLGYSEYICDESVALQYLKTNNSFYSLDFLLSQHKGPMQYLIGGIVFLFSKDILNELIYRIPFSISNILSIIFLYLFLKNVTRSKSAAFFASLVFGVNGMIVAFGRIFQYQSFNLMFSFLSLYFYSNLEIIDEKKDQNYVIRNSLVGTFFFCLSVLSHWDAVFVTPYIVFMIFRNILFNKRYSKEFKKRFVLFNSIFIIFLSAFYLLPYISHFKSSVENQEYFKNRVSPGVISLSKFIERVKFMVFRIKLYNPFFYLELFLASAVLSLLFVKKLWLYSIWFFAEFLIFILVFTNPGTHIYNLFIPLSVILAFLINKILSFTGKIRKKGFILGVRITIVLIFTLISSFFYYQTFTMFVDHNPEYPWRKKNILNYEAGSFTNEERSKYLRNNKIGFPLRREWEKIEEIMSEYENKNGLSPGELSIETNENECPVNFYTGRKINSSGRRFVVGVKYPLSFVNDYKGFSKAKHKELIYSVKNQDGDTVAVIHVSD